ncbi:hypothetical protein GIB67_012917 [Kingdonia uniflora]|uniref:ribonuclease P n=1 Tax=Kingdonia uniflora TaxID=39325 RepID=A0A7J7NG87_9MAGN|nr:hypothetical protein GIB67_012917 [Kingdonia uniflora]
METSMSRRQVKKQKKALNREGKFMYQLGTCSKKNDFSEALSLYEDAVSQNLRLDHNHYNTLFYLCSNAPIKTLDIVEKGFSIFDRMLSNKINPNEATITSVARLAAAKGDGNLAFELVKTMRDKYNSVPKLRTYDPALFCFCEKVEADNAYLVEQHMGSMGVHLEESELAALLKVSTEVGKEDKVYTYLQKIMIRASCVSALTAEIIESWFCSNLASDVGALSWDESEVRYAILKNGGGWHGKGWLGKGKWVVRRSNISSEGCCCSCGEHLVCVDIDKGETEKFAESIASLALEREARSNFKNFQEWLDNHTEFGAIVDGANVGLYQQNFADGGFSFSQLEAVVKELYERSQRQWPLVILHNKRIRPLMDNASSRILLEEWRSKGALYTTPHGSNDDWYWLYAAVKRKCLLVTNDEMRDHIFELLGTNFFLKWKERHQVRFTFMRCTPVLQMPPSYSVVIQESEKGSWHIPIDGQSNNEASRTWLCVSRPKPSEHYDATLMNSECKSPYTCATKTVGSQNGFHGNLKSVKPCDSESISMTGKRKDRSPSPSK